jgi:hypothetical protein
VVDVVRRQPLEAADQAEDPEPEVDGTAADQEAMRDRIAASGGRQ